MGKTVKPNRSIQFPWLEAFQESPIKTSFHLHILFSALISRHFWMQSLLMTPFNYIQSLWIKQLWRGNIAMYSFAFPDHVHCKIYNYIKNASKKRQRNYFLNKFLFITKDINFDLALNIAGSRISSILFESWSYHNNVPFPLTDWHCDKIFMPIFQRKLPFCLGLMFQHYNLLPKLIYYMINVSLYIHSSHIAVSMKENILLYLKENCQDTNLLSIFQINRILKFMLIFKV